MSRIILHIDMNSYFASVEQQANPHLRGKPVGVCEHLGGIIIAPSVEAKRMGIKLGTTVWDARKIYPQIILLHTDPEKYRTVSARWMKILHDYSDRVEQFSIDEAFVDISAYCRGDYGEALLLGLEIKQRLRLEVGEWVSASVGIGPNKLISKIAADLDSGVINLGCHSEASASWRIAEESQEILQEYPQDDKNFLDRICIIRPEQISNLYNRLKLTDVPGIGRRLERALHKLGIFTLRQLAAYPLENLLNQFGLNGWILHGLANFNFPSFSSYPLVGEERWGGEDPPKSFGHAYTVPKALTSISDIKKLMFKLAEKVGRRMRKHNAFGNVVHYFYAGPPSLIPPPRGGRLGGGEVLSFSKQHKINEFINDGKDIFKVAWSIFCGDLPQPLPRPGEGLGERSNKSVKIMGISVSGLKFNDSRDFLFPQYYRSGRLLEIMDKINDKYGEYTIVRGRMSDAPPDWAKDTVGFRKV